MARSNQKHPASIAGRPESFYLKHNAISKNARLYYEGKLTPGDYPPTLAVLDSVLTRNTETRPFYFFILNQIMKVTDGALSEYLTAVCSKYFSQYPCEFIVWQADPVYEVNLHQWTEFIAFDLYSREALKKYSAGLKTTDCKTKTLDSFLNDLQRIVTELNEH